LGCHLPTPLPTPSTKEPQEGETEAAYQAFKEYLDSDRRRVGEHGPSARNWSMRFHWAHRAREFDVYMSRIDLEEQVRYRRRMNERHRRMAAVAESKIVEWLSTLTPEKIERMWAAVATRLWDVAVRIERAATSAVDLDDLPNPYGEPPHEDSLEQRLIEADLDEHLSDIAQLLHEKLGRPAVPEPPQERPAPPQPAPAEPDQETPPGSVWGGREPGYGRYGSQL
jgi:hypothetical protein